MRDRGWRRGAGGEGGGAGGGLVAVGEVGMAEVAGAKEPNMTNLAGDGMRGMRVDATSESTYQ